MIYGEFDKCIFTEDDLDKYTKIIEKDIEGRKKYLSCFIDRGKERIAWINQCLANKEYTVLGRAYKDGSDKCILLIIRFPDGSQVDIRHSFKKIEGMRKKLDELKQKYDVDLSHFEYL